MFSHDFTKTYSMVSVNERNVIIANIQSDVLVSDCVTGVKQKWWKTKHFPEKDIPTHIYLLGDGTIQELHQRFINKHMDISWSDFINYTRELIKQGILI